MSRASKQFIITLVVGGGVYALLCARGPLFEPHPPPARPATVHATNVLTIHFHERPPYYTFTNGVVSGLCGEPARRAVELAGVPVRWKNTPPQRQIQIIQRGLGLDAGLGWYLTPERGTLARFSAPIYRDNATVALVRRDDPRFDEGLTVDQFLSTPNTVLLVKESYSYGGWLDDRIQRLASRRVAATGNNFTMLRMLEAGRADYLFLTEEEAAELLVTHPSGRGLRMVRFDDMPAGESRHLMFTRVVPPDWIARIDAALTGERPASTP